MRLAAAARLARLADERVGSRPVAPAADPASWWGLRRAHAAATRRSGPPTSRWPCRAARWAACSSARCAGSSPGRRPASPPRSSSMGFGNVLHVLADHLVKVDGVTEESLLRAARLGVGRACSSTAHGSRSGSTSRRAARSTGCWRGIGDGPSGRWWPPSSSSRSPCRWRPLRRSAAGACRPPRAGPRWCAARRRLQDQQEARRAGPHWPTTRSLASTSSRQTGPPSRRMWGSRAHSGGAELVQLRVDDGGLPKVQQQPPQPPDDAGRKPVEIQLISAAEAVRAEAVRCEARQALHVLRLHLDVSRADPLRDGAVVTRPISVTRRPLPSDAASGSATSSWPRSPRRWSPGWSSPARAPVRPR